MLNTIINKFKTDIEDYVLQSDGDFYNKVDVKYVRLDNSKVDSLYPEAINIALFRSNAEKDLVGTYNYSTPTSGNKAMNEKPPLRVGIDVLLLFNFNDYLTAIRSYDQVLAYFYNNDLLHVSDGGDEVNLVQVLMSRFNDLNEIEIWSSFNTPGIPILRYELKYAIIPGRFDELPMVQSVSTTEGILNQDEISTLILNMVYAPVDEILNKVLQKTITFCSIPVPKIKEDFDNLSDTQTESLQEDIKIAYGNLLESYLIAETEITGFKEYLEQQIEEGNLSKVEFEPFIPSISGLILKTIEYYAELEEITPTLNDYFIVCNFTKEKIEGDKGLPSDFISRLVRTTSYLNLINILDQDIINFNQIGGSCYIPSGDKPYMRFQEVIDMSTMQWRKKWWDIESRMTQLNKDYVETDSNELFNIDGEEYAIFKDIIEACLLQLTQPYEEFKLLNKDYNKIDPAIPQKEIQEKFLDAYSKCYPAINYLDGQDVSVVLALALQDIFIKQNI